MRNKLDLLVRIIAIAALVSLASQNGWAQIPTSIQSASSSLGAPFDRQAEYAVNGAGLNGQTHTIVPDAFMWLNNGVFAAPNDLEPEITFDLGSIQALDSMKVWNYNETLPNRPELLDRGVGTADILVAGEDLVFTPFISGQAFDIAPGVDNVDFGQVIDLTGASARYVKFDILSNHGGDNNFVGLSEVQFFAVPEPSSYLAFVFGTAMLALLRRRF
jgi:hypothetical protein